MDSTIDQSDLVEMSLTVPNGLGTVRIFAYPPATDNVVSGSISKGGSWEGDKVGRRCSEFTEAGLKNVNFLDIGANIGTFTLPMAVCVRSYGKVIAVEGMPNIAA